MPGDQALGTAKEQGRGLIRPAEDECVHHQHSSYAEHQSPLQAAARLADRATATPSHQGGSGKADDENDFAVHAPLLAPNQLREQVWINVATRKDDQRFAMRACEARQHCCKCDSASGFQTQTMMLPCKAHSFDDRRFGYGQRLSLAIPENIEGEWGYPQGLERIASRFGRVWQDWNDLAPA